MGRLQRTVEQNVRDTQMTTCVTKGARLARPRSFPASRGFDARARVPPLTSTKSEEKEKLLAVYLQRRLCERLLLLNITPQSTRLEKNRSDNLKFLLVPTSLKWNLEPPRGVLPYMGYIGMCRCEGYGFQAVYSRIGYINQSVWIIFHETDQLVEDFI